MGGERAAGLDAVLVASHFDRVDPDDSGGAGSDIGAAPWASHKLQADAEVGMLHPLHRRGITPLQRRAS
jgi:hypothetical protein